MKLGILFAVILAAFVCFEPALATKPAPASGTIAIAPGSDLNLGGLVTFDVTVTNIGNQNPRIQVVCSQDGAIVYAAAQNVNGWLGPAPFDGPTFLLGGGSSQWLINGGPADCVASLYYWDFHPVQTFVPLAPPLSFSAGGG